MKLREFFKLKHLALSFCLGIALMVLFFPLVSLMGEEAAVRIVMWPGMLLSRASGYGGHDLPGILLYFLGNILFYWLLALFFLGWWKARQRVHVGDRPASGPADTTTTR
jgi:hypothetical protein